MSVNLYERTWDIIGGEYLEEARDRLQAGKYIFALRNYAAAIQSYLRGAIPFTLEQEDPRPSELWEALALCQVSKDIQSPISIPMLSNRDTEFLRLIDTATLLDVSLSGNTSPLLENLDDGELLERAERFAVVAQAACRCAAVYAEFIADSEDDSVDDEAEASGDRAVPGENVYDVLESLIPPESDDGVDDEDDDYTDVDPTITEVGPRLSDEPASSPSERAETDATGHRVTGDGATEIPFGE